MILFAYRHCASANLYAFVKQWRVKMVTVEIGNHKSDGSNHLVSQIFSHSQKQRIQQQQHLQSIHQPMEFNRPYLVLMFP